MKISKLISITAAMFLLLSSCAVNEADKDKLQVCASFYAMYDFARTIGGDDVQVYLMCPPGSEPHEFEPKTSDIARLNESDIFIYNGLGMEAWAEKTAKTLPERVEILCASEGIEAHGNDPHIWLDLTKASEQLRAVCEAFEKAGGDTQKYRDNLSGYTAEIEELEREYREAGLEGKKLFVIHAAYGYLCEEFGMEQMPLEGISGESDPSPSKMARIVEEIKEEGAQCIFYDPLEGEKIAEAVAKEAGVEARPLYTFEGDSEDRDYVTVMRENLEQLKKGS